MNTIKIFSLAAFFLFSSVVETRAQSVPKSTFKLDVGTETMLALGTKNRDNKLGYGGTLRLNYGLTDKLTLTLTSGYYNYLKTGPLKTFNDNFQVIPVKAGLKYFFAPQFYINGEGGIAFTRTYQNQINSVATGGIGWVYKGLDIGARYETLNGSRGANFNSVGVRIAYGFKL
ncbi:hypothetical protein INP83_19255 [Mucilaginibacter sp. 21P]|uniref:hypothetical protein n=1 Tax=Mucilaginibacter sp. 21P TaxID=2778902 RepID=UPI001C595F0C|nr:hypothetical protein [Mucilaginibacter sp. 21P]QXV65191.1 hypothetical protein INP83_19255 [Mucilaginibacter sp. 21P]